MAVEFISISGVLCEKVLQEQAVFSAIRIVDVFGIPHDALPATTAVQFEALIYVRGFPSAETFNVGFTVEGASGERQEVPRPPGNPFRFDVFEGDPTIPVGLGIIVNLTIGASKIGTNYLDVEVDGILRLRLPFTLRRIPAPPPVQ